MKKSLILQQLNKKMIAFSNIQEADNPPTGWIRAIRLALRMSMTQLGNKLSITKQGISDIESREKDGAITIKSLKEIGKAMDMKLVYGFIPNDGSLNALVERKARALATQIVLRTSNTMKLENQENSKERIEKAIDERTEEILKDMPKILWD